MKQARYKYHLQRRGDPRPPAHVRVCTPIRRARMREYRPQKGFARR